MCKSACALFIPLSAVPILCGLQVATIGYLEGATGPTV